jgi:hypothetical protein
MPQQGLSDEQIEQETAVALPEREAMSLIDGGVRLVPISPGVVPSPQPPVDAPPPVDDTVGKGIDERITE